jgi:hypothetical protein
MKRVGLAGAAVPLVISLVSGVWAGCSSDASSGAQPSDDSGASDDGGAPEAAADGPDFGAPSSTYPAYMPSVPQTTNATGGPVLHDITVVPVVYAGDTGAANVGDFLAKYAASASYAAQAADYGVGTLTIGTTITLTDTAPTMITRDDIRAFLRDRLDGTHPEWGGNDTTTLAKTVFLLVYPSGTTIAKAAGDTSCGAFQGFHDTAPLAAGADAGASTLPADATPIYAAIPRCVATGLSESASLTMAINHELLEAATDPLPAPRVAFDDLDDDHFVWGPAMRGPEVADLCDYAGSFFAPADVGYTIARVWSNSAARAYHDPCVPAPAGAYFNTAIPTETVALNAMRSTKGIAVSVGKTKTVDVLFFSNAATTAPWTIAAREWQLNPADPLVLDVKLDRTAGTNGEKAHLTVTAKSATPSGRSAILVSSKLGTRESLWFTWVAVQ